MLSLAVSHRFVLTFLLENKMKLSTDGSLNTFFDRTHKTEPLSVRKLFIEDVKLLKLGSSLLPSDLFHFPQNQL